MVFYTIKRIEHRSLLLLFPLLCLALISSALDPRVPQQFSDEFRYSILLISRLLFPGLFALFAAFMIPSNWRSAQATSVVLTYCLLIAFDLPGLNNLYFCATPFVIAALASTLLFLPSETQVHRGFRHACKLICYAILLSSAVYFFLLTVIRGLDNFIYLTFTKGFVSSTMATFVAPSFTIMQTVGYSEIINSIESLKAVDPHIAAISTAIVLTNLISLPSIMLSRAIFSSPRVRVFLTALALITVITSQIGICISIELAVLLMFFPGTYVLLLCSSSLLCYFCYSNRALMMTDIEQLYSPDLIINTTDFFRLSGGDYRCMLYAALVPLALMVTVLLIKSSHGMVLETRSADKKGVRYKLTEQNRPDLVMIGLLHACGGMSNIADVNQQGREVLLTICDSELLLQPELIAICNRRPHLDRTRMILSCDLGSNCAVVAQRLTNLLKSGGFMVRPAPTQTFSITTYIANRDNLMSKPS